MNFLRGGSRLKNRKLCSCRRSLNNICSCFPSKSLLTLQRATRPKKMGVEGETKGGGSPFFAPTGEIPAEPKQSLNFVSAFSAYFIASKSAALEAKAFSRPIFVDSLFAYQTKRFSCHKYLSQCVQSQKHNTVIFST